MLKPGDLVVIEGVVHWELIRGAFGGGALDSEGRAGLGGQSQDADFVAGADLVVVCGVCKRERQHSLQHNQTVVIHL